MIKRYIYAVIALLIATPFLFVSAMTSKTGDVIEQKEPIDGSAFFAGDKIKIGADISGDLFVFGNEVTIDGKVDGDIIGAGGKLIINQPIEGDLRFAAGEMEINNNIAENITVIAQDFSLKQGATIGKDAYLLSEKASFDGGIIGRLEIIGSSAELKGSIGKDLNFYSDTKDATGVTLSPEAQVGGSINYNAEGEIKGVELGKNVMGEVNKYPPMAPEAPSKGDAVFSVVGFFVSLLLVICVVIFILGRNIKDIQKSMVSNPAKSTGLGAVLLIALPIISIAFIISGFGMFLGLSGLLLWLLLIPFSCIFSIISLGELAMRKIKPEMSGKIYYTALCGLVISFIVFYIPLLGFLMMIFFMWWGSGGLLMKFLESRSDDIIISKKEEALEVISEEKKD